MVLRLGLLVNAPSFFGLVVAHEGDFYSFIESFVVHLSLIGLAGLLVAYREETLHLFLIRHSLPRLELEDLSYLLYTLDLLKSCCCSRLSWTVVSLTRFPVDTIFEYLRVKATSVSIRLRIYLCALIYTNTVPTGFFLVLFLICSVVNMHNGIHPIQSHVTTHARKSEHCKSNQARHISRYTGKPVLY
jgi:hypothetical protein